MTALKVTLDNIFTEDMPVSQEVKIEWGDGKHGGKWIQ